MAIILVGTLDTKGEELAFVRAQLRKAGLECRVVDAGSVGPPSFAPDVTREAVFEAAGVRVEELTERGEAVEAAAQGVMRVVEAPPKRRCGGDSGDRRIGGNNDWHERDASTAVRSAEGDGDDPGERADAALCGRQRPGVVSISGGRVRAESADDDSAAERGVGLAGMVRGRKGLGERASSERPLVTATMFGVTTPCVTRARVSLEQRGCEVIVFHATGVGGQAMEGLIRDGLVSGVLDLTTTEIADEVVGGLLSAGPDRLRAAVEAKVPQVVSLGVLDMVNFGSIETVPERFRGRKLHVHNANVTLMRTTAEENARMGRFIVEALARAESTVVVLVPRGGVSALDVPGKPFHDPEADEALFSAVRDGLCGHRWVRVDEREEGINEPVFADAAVKALTELMSVRVGAE